MITNTDSELKNKYLNNLKDMRHNYIDDLPTQRLQPWDKNYQAYKCRGNYICWVSNYISRLILKSLLKDEKTIEEGKKFMDHTKNRDREKLTTVEEITMVNEILDKLIHDLENN